jgi:hypothetical protein
MSLKIRLLQKQLNENKLLKGKRLQFVPLDTSVNSEWLFIIDGEIRNIEHYLTPEQIQLLNETKKEI